MSGANQNGRKTHDDNATMSGHIAHARSRLTTDQNGKRSQDDDVGRANAGGHIAHAGSRHAADQYRWAARRENRPAYVGHKAGYHGAGMHISQTSCRLTHFLTPVCPTHAAVYALLT